MTTPLPSAPFASVSDLQGGTTNLLVWKPVGPNNVPQALQAELTTLAQALPSIYDFIVTGSLTTINDFQTLLPNLPVMPNQRCINILTGQVTAQNTTSGDSAVWDVVVNLKRIGAGVLPSYISGSALPVTTRCLDSAMTGCEIVLAISSTGPVVSVIGIAATSIEWAYTFTVVTAD